MSIYSDLAKDTVEKYLMDESLTKTVNLPVELLNQKNGCFVSIHSKDDQLRGCIGTIIPTHKNLAGEIISNAIEAAFHDPRFNPITKNDLANLKYSVDVLSEPEPIESEKELDVKKFGVIVKSLDGFKTGLLLPNLDGVDDIKTQVSIAKEKAGIAPDEEVLLYRFVSKRFE